MQHTLRAYSIFFLVASAAVIGFVFLFQYSIAQLVPSDTMYTFASGHMGDYFEYVSMIKEGQQGYLLEQFPYETDPIPPAPVHPYFHIIGILSKPFDINPFLAFFIARLSAMALFFLSMGILIHRTFSRQITQILAAIFFFTSTAFYGVSGSVGAFKIQDQTISSDYFDIFIRFLRVPPHHFVALSCFVGLLIFIGKKRTSLSWWISTLFLIMSLGSLHPYILLIFSLVAGSHLMIKVITQRKLTPLILSHMILLGLTAIVLFIQRYMWVSLLQASWCMHETLTLTHRTIPLITYFKMLGPLVVLAPFIIVHKKLLRNAYIQLSVLWAGIPILMFLAPDIGIPTASHRIFQSYQQAPLAILGAAVIEQIGEKTKALKLIALVFGVFALGYAIFPIAIKTQTYFSYIDTNIFNIYVPNYLVDTFAYLQKNTPPQSVVLGGVTVSNMIPAFTHNKVIIGRDNVRDFITKRTESYDFLNSVLSEDDMLTFLRTYHISYILYGIDAPAFQNVSYRTAPFLKEIYTNGIISVVQVVGLNEAKQD